MVREVIIQVPRRKLRIEQAGIVLDDKQTDVFRQQLLQLQQDVSALKASAASAAEIVALDQTSVGRLSRMDALQGQAMSLEQGRRRERELQKIAAALRRIEAGDYGDCLACDEPIAIERLTLDPAATLCIRCASAREDQR